MSGECGNFDRSNTTKDLLSGEEEEKEPKEDILVKYLHNPESKSTTKKPLDY